MKSLNEYLNNLYLNNLNIVFENLDDKTSLQEVYEEIGYQMIENDMLCEGLGSWLRKLASKGDKLDAKAASIRDAAKEKLKNLSDSAKAAIENVKKAAGDKWESMKKTYESIVATVDSAVQSSKGAIEAISKTIGQKVSNIETALSTTFANAIATGSDFDKKLIDWASSSNDADKKIVSAITTFSTAALTAKKSGVDANTLYSVLKALGI